MHRPITTTAVTPTSVILGHRFDILLGSPASGPGTAPASGPGTAPASGPGTAPASGPGTAPASGPGTAPASGPGTAPASAPTLLPASAAASITALPLTFALVLTLITILREDATIGAMINTPTARAAPLTSRK